MLTIFKIFQQNTHFCFYLLRFLSIQFGRDHIMLLQISKAHIFLEETFLIFISQSLMLKLTFLFVLSYFFKIDFFLISPIVLLCLNFGAFSFRHRVPRIRKHIVCPSFHFLYQRLWKKENELSALSPSQSNVVLRWKRKVRHFLHFHPNLRTVNIQFYFTFGFSGQGKKTRNPEA